MKFSRRATVHLGSVYIGVDSKIDCGDRSILMWFIFTAQIWPWKHSYKKFAILTTLQVEKRWDKVKTSVVLKHSQNVKAADSIKIFKQAYVKCPLMLAWVIDYPMQAVSLIFSCSTEHLGFALCVYPRAEGIHIRQSPNSCVATITYIRRAEVASQIIFLAQFYSHCGTIAWFSHVMLTMQLHWFLYK